MIPFEYAAPTTLREAVSLLGEMNGRAKVLAGGTDLLVQLREGMRHAEFVLDVKKIPELMEMSFTPEKGLKLGAAVPCYRVYGDPQIRAAYSALTDAALIVGGWQIQSRASVGGNLCNSSPAGDTIPALFAYDATCRIAGPGGVREVPATEFCTAPGRNVLQPGELLVSLSFQPPAPRSGAAYQRFIPRNEMDIAVVGAASWVQLDASGAAVEKARIALGAVAPRPVFAEEASAWLVGQPATEEVFARAGELAKKVATPIDDMRGTRDYRIHLASVLTKRTLALAVERARNETPAT